MADKEKKPDKPKKETSKEVIPPVKSDQFQIIPMMEPPEKVKKRSD